MNDRGQPLRDDEIIAFDQTIEGLEDLELIISLIGFDKAVGFGDDLGLDDFNPELNRDECESDACYQITLDPQYGIISEEPNDADGGGSLAEWSLIYTPDSNFPYSEPVFGVDSLQYRIYNKFRDYEYCSENPSDDNCYDEIDETDDGWSDEATITFNIYQENDIPVIANIDPLSLNEDDQISVDLEVIDPESDELIYFIMYLMRR